MGPWGGANYSTDPEAHHQLGIPTYVRLPSIKILRELGSGASAQVMLGRLEGAFEGWPQGTEVAVKQLKPELAEDARALEALAREARVAAAVRHESFARILHQQGAQLVREALPGIDLGAELASRGRLPESEVRAIGQRLAAGLAALHAAGWAHGDVKPENVCVDIREGASWMDLGFATKLPAPGLAPDPYLMGNTRRGTAAYLAPEQARGEAGNAASDVFALGIVLFEIATGSHPVLHNESGGASDPELVLHDIREANFGLPSSRVSSLSPFFDHLLSAMLARDPNERPSAAEIAERFAGGEDGSWWRQQLATKGGALLTTRQDLIPLVGRRDELRHLHDAYDQTLASGGRVVWLEGGAASGKWRLVRDFVAHVRCSEHPPTFLAERASEWREEWPGRPIRTMLRKALAIAPSRAPSDRDRAQLFENLPEDLARSLIQILTPDATGPTEVAPQVALAAGLRYVSRTRPVVLFLNDIHWADQLTLGVLSQLTEDLRKTSLLVILGLRTEGVAHHPQALDRLRQRADIWGTGTTLELGPLNDEAILEAVSAMFAPSVPRLRLAQVLAERSHGSPGLLTEVLRQLVSRGHAVPAPNPSDGWVLTIAPDHIPASRSAARLIAERLTQLSVDQRLWLQRLSVVGGRLDAEFLVRAFDLTEDDAHTWIETFVRTGWLITDGARTRFARPAERAQVYRSIAPERRARLHGRAASAFGGLASGSLHAAYQQAYHLHAAGQHDKLLPMVRDLVHKLSERGHPGRVRAVTEWGIQAISELDTDENHDALRFELLVTAADISDRLGDRRDQREVLDQLADLELDPDSDARTAGRVYLLHGRFQAHTGNFGLARGMLRNAVHFMQRAEEFGPASDALCRLALVQAHVGEPDEASKLARRARSLAQTDLERANASLALAVVDLMQNRVQDVLRRAQGVIDQLESRKETVAERSVIAAADILAARAWAIVGRTDRAVAIVEEAVRLARLSGERRLESEARARHGRLLMDLGDAPGAELVLRDALLLAREIEDPLGEALANVFLGTLLAETDRDGAAESLEVAVERARSLGLHRTEALGLGLRARLAMFEDGPERALELGRRATDLVERYGAELPDRIVICATHALVLRRAGERRRADQVERDLRRTVKRQNQELDDPDLRRPQWLYTARLLETTLSAEGPIYPLASVAPKA